MLNLKLTADRRPLVSETRRKSGREIILDGIRQQICLLSDAAYKVERIRYVKDETGKSIRTVITAPPKPWWWNANGSLLVQIKYGHASVVEIEPGKPTVVAGKSQKDVISVLTEISKAVQDGHLDAQIAAAKEKARQARNPKS